MTKRKKLSITVLTQEYPPYGSGIAHVCTEVVSRLKARGHSVKVCSPVGPDVKLGSKPLIQKTGGLGLIWFWLRTRKLLRAASEEVFWIHNPLFLSSINYEKSLSTVHSTYYHYGLFDKSEISFVFRQYYKFMQAVERRSMRCLRQNSFSSVSAAVKEELHELGLEPGKVLVIPNGVDTETFVPKKHQEYRLVFVGRFVVQKQPLQLLRVFAKLREIDSRYTLHLVGYGPLEDAMNKLVKDLEIEGVVFTGRLSGQQVVEQYQMAHAHLLGSSYEGQPLSVLEAMSCATPCIVNNISTLKQVVKDAPACIATNFSNEDLAAKTIHLHLQKDLDREALRAYTKKHHDWEVIVDEYEEKLHQISKD